MSAVTIYGLKAWNEEDRTAGLMVPSSRPVGHIEIGRSDCMNMGILKELEMLFKLTALAFCMTYAKSLQKVRDIKLICLLRQLGTITHVKSGSTNRHQSMQQSIACFHRCATFNSV